MMTGKELIRWIQENRAEDLPVLIAHRDSGGSYSTAEHLGEFEEPRLCEFRDELRGVIGTVNYETDKPTAMIL